MDHHSENLIVMVTLRRYRTEGLAFIRTTTLISLSPPLHLFCSRDLAGDLRFCLLSAVDFCLYRVSYFDSPHIHLFEFQIGHRYLVYCRSGAALLIVGCPV